MKMRVLYSSTNKKIINYAIALGDAQEDARAKADAIPPAYSCDRERLVVLVLSVSSRVDDNTRRFIGELTEARTTNVAIVFESKDKVITPSMKSVIDTINNAGSRVLEDQLYFVTGGGLFSSKLSIEERSEIVEWCEKVKESIV